MKLLTFATESHRRLLYDFFIPSIKEADNFELHITKGCQISSDGKYGGKGFAETTMNKILSIVAILNGTPDGEYVLYSDCDVVFLKPVNAYLEKYKDFDIVFQDGFPQLNTGFMLIRNSQVMRAMLRQCSCMCKGYMHDQDILNAIIKNYQIIFTKFDTSIRSAADFLFPDLWEGQKLNIPSNTLVFHACWCMGIKNKYDLLFQVVNVK